MKQKKILTKYSNTILKFFNEAIIAKINITAGTDNQIKKEIQ
jgi:hypothetical protein